MAERPTYSLQILLGTVAAFAVAAGAFAAPPSLISGLLVQVLGTCLPALLVVVWCSGKGYRRSFVIGAVGPAALCSYCMLKALAHEHGLPSNYTIIYSAKEIFDAGTIYHRPFVFALTALAICGGLACMAMHWLMTGRKSDAPLPEENHTE